MSNVNAQGLAGVSGRFRLIKHDMRPFLRGERTLKDVSELVERDAQGRIVRDAEGWPIMRHPDLILEDKVARNKVLKRGLTKFSYRAYSGEIGNPTSIGRTTPTEVTGDHNARNPWQAIFLAGDNVGGTPAVADLRVDFTESDGANDVKVPVNPGIAGRGVRAILISDTTGPGLKRDSINYPTTNPYEEIEYIFFAQATTPTGYSSGTIQAVAKATNIFDNETFVLDDGINPAVTFKFQATGAAVIGAGEAEVDIQAETTAADVGAQMARVINAESERLHLSASADGAGLVTITHTAGGAIGNVTTWTESVTGAGFVIVQPSGGSSETVGWATNSEVDDDGLDNVKFKAIGMAQGVQCGNTGADNEIAARSIIGLSANAGGVSDRKYIHEHGGTPGFQYTSAAQDVAANGAGWVQSDDNPGSPAVGNQEQTIDTIASHARDQIVTGNKVHMFNGNFTQADVGRAFDIAGSGAGNNGRKTIKTVFNKVKIETNEAVSAEGTGFTATVIEPNEGHRAFDGDITELTKTGLFKLGFKYRSEDSAGPHILGRVFGTSPPATQVRGIRLTHPALTPKDNCVDDFTIQYLDLQKAPGLVTSALNPFDDAHWTDIDTPYTGEADSIFNAGEKGYEYLFTTPPPQADCYGIRIKDATAFDTNKALEVAEFYIFEAETAGNLTLTAGVDDTLMVATDAVPSGPGVPNPTPGTYTTKQLGAVIGTGNPANEDVQALADAINKQFRGRELEAIRTELGQLVLRTTVAGDPVQMDIAKDTPDGSTATVQLGFASTGVLVQKTGTTQYVVKLAADIMTIIYRLSLRGDLPTV